MSLKRLRKNLNKATAVAAVIGIATCVFPAIAQAQLRRVFQSSGNSDLQSDVIINFSLDTSVENTNSLDSDQGEFPGAIQNFTDSGNPNTDLSPLSFTSGDLTVSTLTTDPNTGNFPGLDIGYQDITGDTLSSAFNNDGLRYDVTFPDGTELTLFIPSNDSSLINSLSSLSDFLSSTGDNQIEGVLHRPDGREEKLIFRNLPDRRGFKFSTVPD